MVHLLETMRKTCEGTPQQYGHEPDGVIENKEYKILDIKSHSSLFAKVFKSSRNKRCTHFSPFFQVHPDSTFLNIWVRGIIQIENSNDDKLSSRNMPLLISKFARYSPHDIKFVFQFLIDFLINCTIFSDTCTNSRISKIHK